MARYNKLLIVLLTLVLFLVGGLSVYAYQKHQDYVNNSEKHENTPQPKHDKKIKKTIEDKDKEFNSKTELNDKVKIYEEVISKKEEVEKLNEEELKKSYGETTDKMKKNIIETVDSLIKENTLTLADQLIKEKFDNSTKKLEEVKSVINEKGKLFYEEQEILRLTQQIDTLIANYKFNVEQNATQGQTQTVVVEEPQTQPQRVPNNPNTTVNNSSRTTRTEGPTSNTVTRTENERSNSSFVNREQPIDTSNDN